MTSDSKELQKEENAKTKFIYMVIQCRLFMGGFVMWTAFTDKQGADTEAARLNSELIGDDRPVYDSWGLVEGIEYLVVNVELR